MVDKISNLLPSDPRVIPCRRSRSASPSLRYASQQQPFSGISNKNQIVIAGVIFGHVCGKYIYVRMFRNEKPGDRVGVKQFMTWAVITLILWTIAFIIAES
jgi:hypothetical protein